MSELVKIIDLLKLPKEMLDKAEKLFYAIFGKSIDEYGLLLQDKVRLRRFRNQLRIFAKAEELLERSNLEQREIPLKLLVPLIDYSSLEDNETLQQKWANLLANLVSEQEEDAFTNLYIEILNRLSVSDVLVLDYLYSRLVEYYSQRKIVEKILFEKLSTGEIRVDDFKFNFSSINELQFSFERLILSLEILTNQGLLKWDVPSISTKFGFQFGSSAYNSSIGSIFDRSGTKYTLSESNNFYISNLGLKFIKACKFGK